MISSMTFIQSNGWTEIDLILKQKWRWFIWWQVSFKYPTRPDTYIHVLYARLYLDTFVYHVIHQSTWDYHCLFGVDGELPNSLKKTDLTNLWKYHIPSSFFLSLRPMTLVSFLFLPCSEVCPPRVCTLLSFWSINSSQYHVIVNHVTVFSVLIGKSKVELCDPQCKIWVLIS